METFMKQDFVITKFVIAIYVDSGKGQPVHRNRPHYGLVYQCKGQKRYRFDTGKVFTVKKGDVFYLPKGSNYEVEVSGEWEAQDGCYAINFDTDKELGRQPFLFHPAGAQSYLEHFREAERAWRAGQAGDTMRCMSELYKILGAMRKNYAQGYIPQDKLLLIQPALTYIDENFTKKNISVAELAQSCNISESYLRQLFLKLCGTAPKHFIINKKIKRACELLRSEEYSVAAVAEQCGYKDEYYFSREFSRIIGCAPSVYAKNNKDV